VNAPSKKPQAAETVADVLAEMDKRRADNLRIWNALGKTDPAHTKGFSRAGGFRGTAIKPIWITQRLTEQFGPCGVGWGMGEPQFQVVPAGDEVLVYCTTEGWYREAEKTATVYGVGGDKILTKRNDGKLFHDDEAFKKAFTDALGNAFKFVGVGADVHMGLFEDSKYVEDMRREFNDTPANDGNGPAPRTKLDGQHTSKTALRGAVNAIMNAVRKADSNDVINDILRTPANKKTIEQAERDWPELINGDPKIEGDGGLKGYVTRCREALNGSLVFQLLISTLSECETAANLADWNRRNGDRISELDGEESRKFEAFYDEKSASLKEQA
jgi:hypothetical protein